MSCICQYFVPVMDQIQSETSKNEFINTEKETLEDQTDDKDVQFSNSNVSATDLAAARAKIWLLTKNLTEAHMSVKNLENLIKTIIDKQNIILKEMYNLKRTNCKLQEECRMQRDHQTMERNAMLRELHDIKLVLSNRTKLLEETVERNNELTYAYQDANAKIYLLSMKYLKLRAKRSREASESSNSGRSSDIEQSE